jgi:hypothetical protein
MAITLRLAIFVLAMLVLAAAQPTTARACESWHGGSQVRCLTSGSAAKTGETVTLRNDGAHSLIFSMQKWFSHCGEDSEHEPTLVKTYQVEPGAAAVLSTAQSENVSETCTELFIFDCRSGDDWIDCAAAVTAEISLQTPAPAVTPPLRRACESWKGGTEFRCLSSMEDAYTQEPVQVLSLWTGDVTFSVQEWYSLCSYQHAVPPTAKESHHLTSGSSLVLPGKELPAEVATFNPAACREIFIFDCRTGGTAVPCSAWMVATIGQ